MNKYRENRERPVKKFHRFSISDLLAEPQSKGSLLKAFAFINVDQSACCKQDK